MLGQRLVAIDAEILFLISKTERKDHVTDGNSVRTGIGMAGRTDIGRTGTMQEEEAETETTRDTEAAVANEVEMRDPATTEAGVQGAIGMTVIEDECGRITSHH